MGKNQIKGLTIEIGGDTTKLGQALENVNKKSSSLSNELGAINRLLKLDPTNVDLLAQKQKVLAEAISNTEAKLGTLREAEKQVQAQFERGEVSEEQYRSLRWEILETETKLKQYQKAAEETAAASEKLADGTDDAAKQLEEEKQKAQAAERATEELGESAADAAKTGLTALAAAATAVVTGIVAMAEASREYRTEKGKLDAAYLSSKHSSETATEAYKELQSIIGETDQAVEAAQQIALLADSEKDVAEWSELAAGVVGKFGDALQPETFYEAANETMKLGEATGAYVQMLEGVGMSVEEFNEGLAACTTEEQKQKYMLDTTRKALGNAAEQYKRTNAEVIEANKSTENWNATVAKIGGHVEPVITDIKNFGAALLEDAEEPIKDIANFVRDKLLPAIDSAGSWVRQNVPVISATMAGLTGAIIAHKVAVLATKTATEGVTVATYLQVAAQKVLDAVMAASPWGLVATLIGGVASALIVLAATTGDAAAETDTLTEKERELMESAEKTAEAFRDQQEATAETIDGITGEMDRVKDLSNELQNLADASGRVRDADQERAQYILGELNSALGTEYQMVDGVIQQYDTLMTSIHNVIQSKLAESLLEASNADYVAAVQAKTAAYESLMLAQEDYQTQLAAAVEAEEKAAAAREALNKKIADAKTESDMRMLASEGEWVTALEASAEKARETADEKKATLDQVAADYSNYVNTISQYQSAETAVLQGNYDTAVDLLTQKGQLYGEYADMVDTETARVLATLQQEAVDAGIQAEKTRENFENGVAGYTQEMVDEAQRAYADAMMAFANAYADAEAVGQDLGDGLSGGLENKRAALLNKARSLVSDTINAMRFEADSHSPARKTIDFGEDMGEGAEIGIKNKTADVARAGQEQAAAVLEAYRSQEVAGQRALQGVAARQMSATVSNQMSAAAANAPILEKILAAIERGQVLVLDGDAIVGGTLNRTDQLLGQRRELVEMGAL